MRIGAWTDHLLYAALMNPMRSATESKEMTKMIKHNLRSQLLTKADFTRKRIKIHVCMFRCAFMYMGQRRESCRSSIHVHSPLCVLLLNEERPHKYGRSVTP